LAISIKLRSYGNVTSNFTGGFILFDDAQYSNTYGFKRLQYTSVDYNGTNTPYYLSDQTISTPDGRATIGIPGIATLGDAKNIVPFSRTANHAEGSFTIADGEASHAEGSGSTSIGDYSHAEGTTTQAIGSGSHAEGSSTLAVGNYSHAEGLQTQTINPNSHTEGNSTYTGQYGYEATYGGEPGAYRLLSKYGNVTSSFTNIYLIVDDSFEDNTVGLKAVRFETVSFSGARTDITLSEGLTTSKLYIGISGVFAPVVADKIIPVNKESSHAEGSGSFALGTGAHAEGYNTRAIGNYSNTKGLGTIAEGEGQVVIGRYNVPTASSAISFIVGYGTGEDDRRTAMYVQGSNVFMAGGLTVGSTITGNLSGNATTATTAITSSYITSSNVFGPFGGNSILSASFAVSSSRAISSSFAQTASFAPAYLPLTGGTINGDVIVNGTASIAFLNVTYESASVIYSSGSNQFGDATNDTQTLIGTVIVSGSQQITGSLNVSQGITGSLFGTASYANYALTASYSNNLQISGSINNVDYIDFNTGSVVTQPIAGRISWNDADGTLNIGLKGNNVTLQVGQEEVLRVVNKTGGNLLESQYRVVRVRSVAEGGAQGQRLAVVLAQADNDANSATTLGIVTENIDVNQEGFTTTFGKVRGIDTTGTLQGESWVDGDMIYLSPTTPGYITNVKPQAPQHTVILGYVVYAHANNGIIFVKVDNGYEIDELHNVRIDTGSLTSGQLLVRSGSVWVNSNQLTGSYGLTGSLQATSFSGSLFGTSSWATNSVTASYITSSNVQGPFGADSILSASYALTASYALNAGGGGSGGTDLGLVQAFSVGLQNIF
jgi:hypothetical protein